LKNLSEKSGRTPKKSCGVYDVVVSKCLSKFPISCGNWKGLNNMVK